MASSLYDVIVVGAGVAGSAMAHALASRPRLRPLRIAVVERSLSEPNRIVGELLQPAGVAALQRLGMEACIEGIGAISVRGYAVINNGQSVEIPYPVGRDGRSFRHGRFVGALRSVAKGNPNIDFIEGSVMELLESPRTQKIIGVRIIAAAQLTKTENEFSIYASLVIVADGCFSNFRSIVLGGNACAPVTQSYFVGIILNNVALPVARHGTVILSDGHQPVLLYQVSEHDTRMLVDVKYPLPDDLKSHILVKILPTLPLSLHQAVRDAIDQGGIRRMPNSFLPPVNQGGRTTKEGAILLGDSWNMRHPLTGGGMTVALNDVVKLSEILLALPDFDDWDRVSRALNTWYWARKPLASTINLLSATLYGIFAQDGPTLLAIRNGCFKYFLLGGECTSGPISLLSGLVPSPVLLIRHFLAVVSYTIWLVLTQSTVDINAYSKGFMYRIIMAYQVLHAAFSLFLPILWSEIKWWAPSKQ